MSQRNDGLKETDSIWGARASTASPIGFLNFQVAYDWLAKEHGVEKSEDWLSLQVYFLLHLSSRRY